MIMCFIFKIDQPFLSLSVNLYRNNDRAGIDLVCLLLVFQQPVFLQFSGSHSRQVHQADKLVFPVAVHFSTVFEILPERSFDRLAVIPVVKGHILQLC